MIAEALVQSIRKLLKRNFRASSAPAPQELRLVTEPGASRDEQAKPTILIPPLCNDFRSTLYVAKPSIKVVKTPGAHSTRRRPTPPHAPRTTRGIQKFCSVTHSLPQPPQNIDATGAEVALCLPNTTMDFVQSVGPHVRLGDHRGHVRLWPSKRPGARSEREVEASQILGTLAARLGVVEEQSDVVVKGGGWSSRPGGEAPATWRAPRPTKVGQPLRKGVREDEGERGARRILNWCAAGRCRHEEGDPHTGRHEQRGR